MTITAHTAAVTVTTATFCGSDAHCGADVGGGTAVGAASARHFIEGGDIVVIDGVRRGRGRGSCGAIITVVAVVVVS